MPLFDSQFTDPDTDVIGYREDGKLVAFSLMKRYDSKNVLASQFAWTYHNPRTRLGIESLKTTQIPVTIYSDSKYVIDSITLGWVFGWVKKGFKGKKNKDLWIRYLKLHSQFDLKYVWVKGHAGHPENERCDVLAVNAAVINPTNIDEGYETDSENDLWS
jgi:hypothetical protein